MKKFPIFSVDDILMLLNIFHFHEQKVATATFNSLILTEAPKPCVSRKLHWFHQAYLLLRAHSIYALTMEGHKNNQA